MCIIISESYITLLKVETLLVPQESKHKGYCPFCGYAQIHYIREPSIKDVVHSADMRRSTISGNQA